PEYLEETLAAYVAHIKTYAPDDREDSTRGLKVLEKYMYGEEARARVDFTQVGSLEMAKKHSYANFKANPEATLCFYQPPAISYELRGKVLIMDENDSGLPEIYQQFLNAQHDVYHAPNMERWLSRPAYLFKIEEIWDNCVSKDGFGTKMEYPYE
ncbi:MAG TPA: hypothetical protein VN540_00760, partial [Clostridia bacterium]|nr:hypothetical protein [Clostridia bacterium]